MANNPVKQPASAGRSLPPWLDPREIGWLNLLLLAAPVALGLKWSGAPGSLVFIFAGLAIIPLAGLMGKATEHLSHRVGPGIGGLLNASFGNAAELIIALFALFKGHDALVKASITGSIVGNLLLVLGLSLLMGGIKFPAQRFNRTAAGVGSSLAVLGAFGMVVPAICHHLVGAGFASVEHRISVGVSLLLFAAYGLSLFFSLVTHKKLYNTGSVEEEGEHERTWGPKAALGVLLGATVGVAIMAEALIGAVEEAGHALGMTEVFMGVIVVAIVGNAAEHSTAVLVAMKDKMDLAYNIAMGSALQIALFVTPVLVFASYLRDEPMDLLFTTMEVAAVVLSVIVTWMVTQDGQSNWFEGVMLLMLYAILGVAFFFLPESAARLELLPGTPSQ